MRLRAPLQQSGGQSLGHARLVVCIVQIGGSFLVRAQIGRNLYGHRRAGHAVNPLQ